MTIDSTMGSNVIETKRTQCFFEITIGNKQQKRIVMELFDYHRKIIIEQNSKIDTITAHLAKNNVLARFSYKKTGFIEIDQNNVDITEDSGLGDWIRNCIKFNDWPMREGRILVVKYIKQM